MNRLRVRLLLLTMLTVVPALGLMVYEAAEQRRQAIAETRDDLLVLAQLVSSRYEQRVEASRHLLSAAARIPMLRWAGGRRCDAFLATLLDEHRNYSNLAVADARGDIVCSALQLRRAVNVADRDYFRAARASGRFSVGGYQVGRIQGKAAIIFAYPLLDRAGAMRRAILAVLDLRWLEELPAELRLPPRATFAMLDDRGRVLARVPHPERWIGRLVDDDPLVARMLVSTDGVGESVGLDGVRRLYAFTTLHDVTGIPSIHLKVGIPLDVAFGPAHRVLSRGLLVLGLAGSLGFAWAWFGTSRLVVRPVRAMLGTTRRVTGGDLTARTGIEPRGGELDELAHALDEMTEALEQRQTTAARAEAALRESNDTLRALIEASPIGIAVLDRDGTVAMWNPAAERILGHAAADVLGSPLPIVTADPSTSVETLIERVLQGEIVLNQEMHHQAIDGSRVELSLSAAPLRDESGAFRAVIAMIVDITTQRVLEAELRQLQKTEALGRLVGGISHDFNNLLTVMLGRAELALGRVPAGDPLARDIQLIQDVGSRAARLTGKLLTFGRRQPHEARVFDLNRLIRNVDEILRRLIGADLELVSELRAPEARIYADPGQIEQVIMNLVVNARDAMPGGGRIVVATDVVPCRVGAGCPLDSAAPEHVELRVVDSGCGMDDHVLAHLFEPFFTTKERGRGTGLGLATVYGIVKQTGGDIRIDSQAGHGTTVIVQLPRAEAPVDRLDRPRGREDDSGTETILVVDDEETIRDVVSEALLRKGYLVVTARDAAAALEILEGDDFQIDLLITDVVMPGMSGAELGERLLARRPQAKIVYVSGDVARAGATLPGSAAFLAKPFTPSVLLQKIRGVLDMSSETCPR